MNFCRVGYMFIYLQIKGSLQSISASSKCNLTLECVDVAADASVGRASRDVVVVAAVGAQGRQRAIALESRRTVHYLQVRYDSARGSQKTMRMLHWCLAGLGAHVLQLL